MMETLTTPRPVQTNSLGSTTKLAPHSSSSSSTPRTRALSHSYLDAFHSPAEFSESQGNAYTHLQPPGGQTVDFSPNAIPVSFHPATGLPAHAPTLTIRRSASANSIRAGTTPPHCISPLPPPPSTNSPAKDPAERIAFRAPFSDEAVDVDVDADGPPLASAVRRLSCEAATCSHHHHRQSLSSTISISCPNSPDEAGEVAASIAMTAVPGGMLVPLISRADEMREMLEDARNAGWVREARSAVGPEGWEELWRLLVRTERMRVADREWLRRVRGWLGEGKAWGEFCAMVGWDGGDWELDDGEGFGREEIGRRESLGGGELTSIQEVEDSEAEKRG